MANYRRIRLDEVNVRAPLPCDIYNAAGQLVAHAQSQLHNHAEWKRMVTEEGLFINLDTLRLHEPSSVRQCLLHAAVRLEHLYQRHDASAPVSASVLHVAHLIQTAWARNRDVMLATVMLCREPITLARRALHTACLVQAVMRSMALNEQIHQQVLAAALILHLGEGNPAAGAHQAVVNRIAGHESNRPYFLRGLGIHDTMWLDLIERASSAIHTPYRQRTSEPLVLASQLIALADLYCARISAPNDEHLDNSRAVMRDLLIERGQYFDALLASHFIRALGVYPVGSAVLLQSGEMGVVCDQSDQIDAPWVCSLIAPLGQPLKAPTLRDTREPLHSIQNTLWSTELLGEVDMESIWGDDARDYSLLQPTPAKTVNASQH